LVSDGTDPGDGGEAGISPEVIGPPVGHFVEQVDLDSGMGRRGSEKSEAELLVVPSPKFTFGEIRRDHFLLGDRIAPIDAALEECISGQAYEDLAREGVVLRVQGSDGIERVEHVCAALERRQEKIDDSESVFFRRDLPVAHDCQPRPLASSSAGDVVY
jgi:hypothetical protein